ncbi:MAG: hypothetical protein GX087_10985 [Desulfobulbaceae bacterium]|nr:hypothetical protein [Desulfobulbaceae bacterium]
MKQHTYLSTLACMFLLGLLWTGLALAAGASNPPAKMNRPEAKRTVPQVMVAYFYNEEALRTMQAELPGVKFNTLTAPELAIGTELLAILPLAGIETAALELCQIRYGDDGVFRPDVAFLHQPLEPASAYVLRTVIAEGMPNLAVCLKSVIQGKHCWTAQHDGMEGGLIFDGTFIRWNKEQYLRYTTSLRGGITLNSAAPHYNNARFGFSLAWTAGTYTVTEADNGDGTTIEDGRGLQMRAYGTMGYSVMSQSFAQAQAELAQSFDSITYRRAQRVSEQADWFVLSGYRGENIGYVKCFFSKDKAVIVDISYPKASQANYEELVKTVAKTFQVHGTDDH